MSTKSVKEYPSSSPIISIPEARKFLGKDGRGLSDEQVEKLIRDFTGIIKSYIKTVSK